MKRWARSFLRALELATATYDDVAQGIGRAYRTLTAYRIGERAITRDAARDLAIYLRGRARTFTAAADEIEAALEKEERHG